MVHTSPIPPHEALESPLGDLCAPSQPACQLTTLVPSPVQIRCCVASSPLDEDKWHYRSGLASQHGLCCTDESPQNSLARLPVDERHYTTNKRGCSTIDGRKAARDARCCIYRQISKPHNLGTLGRWADCPSEAGCVACSMQITCRLLGGGDDSPKEGQYDGFPRSWKPPC